MKTLNPGRLSMWLFRVDKLKVLRLDPSPRLLGLLLNYLGLIRTGYWSDVVLILVVIRHHVVWPGLQSLDLTMRGIILSLLPLLHHHIPDRITVLLLKELISPVFHLVTLRSRRGRG
jgi:hypothetical protein